MDFKPFYNDWIILDSIFTPTNLNFRQYDYIKVNLDYNFFATLNLSDDSLKQYRVDSARYASSILGDKPALCISGGIDSQAMLQCWLEADIKFDTFILVFKKGLNSMDVEQARLVCKNLGVELKEIEIDVIQFLNYFNYDYALKYKSCSPHFNTHYKLFNTLKQQGYTGVCCGGDAPIFNTSDKTWGSNFNRNTHNFIQYSTVSNFPCIGNFLGFYPNLAWAISLQTTPVIANTVTGLNTVNNKNVINEKDTIVKVPTVEIEQQRYNYKIQGYERTGIKVTPQLQKFSGFELVKKYLEELTGDGWMFEKRYRHPLENLLHATFSVPIFVFDKDVESLIRNLYLENIGNQFTSII